MLKKIINVFFNYAFFLYFILIVAAYLFHLKLNPLLLLDYFSILAVIALTTIMRYMISGNILPLRLLKHDSEYGAYQYFKNAEDTILPSAIFITLSIFPIILFHFLLNGKSAAAFIGPGIALIMISNLILAILFVYYLNRESVSIYKLPKSGLMLSRQLATSLGMNIISQINLLLLMVLVICLHAKNDIQTDLRDVSRQFFTIPDGTGSDILLFSLIFTIPATLILYRRFSNKSVLYSAAINLNVSSSVFSICFLVYMVTSLQTMDVITLSVYFINPVKYILLIEIISLVLFTMHYFRNRKRPEIYFKPVVYAGSRRLEAVFGICALALFILAYLKIGIINIYQLAIIFLAIIVINVLSIRKKRAINNLIASRTLELEEKNAENERLLLNILPGSIAERLKNGEGKIADYFERVSVLFADIVGFTQLSQRLTSKDLVEKLNDLFSSFDKIAMKYRIEKIKTIGDCYMAVAGLPEKQENHAELILNMAFEMLDVISLFNERFSMNLAIRIGINSGEVVAGVIGTHKFIYDLWGDSVNIASRMESHGIAGKIHVTRETYDLLKGRYQFEQRGPIEIKGKGKMDTYFALKQ